MGFGLLFFLLPVGHKALLSLGYYLFRSSPRHLGLHTSSSVGSWKTRRRFPRMSPTLSLGHPILYFPTHNTFGKTSIIHAIESPRPFLPGQSCFIPFHTRFYNKNSIKSRTLCLLSWLRNLMLTHRNNRTEQCRIHFLNGTGRYKIVILSRLAPFNGTGFFPYQELQPIKKWLFLLINMKQRFFISSAPIIYLDPLQRGRHDDLWDQQHGIQHGVCLIQIPRRRWIFLLYTICIIRIIMKYAYSRRVFVIKDTTLLKAWERSSTLL